MRSNQSGAGGTRESSEPSESTCQGRAGEQKIRGRSNSKGWTTRGGNKRLEGASGGGPKDWLALAEEAGGGGWVGVSSAAMQTLSWMSKQMWGCLGSAGDCTLLAPLKFQLVQKLQPAHTPSQTGWQASIPGWNSSGHRLWLFVHGTRSALGSSSVSTLALGFVSAVAISVGISWRYVPCRHLGKASLHVPLRKSVKLGGL